MTYIHSRLKTIEQLQENTLESLGWIYQSYSNIHKKLKSVNVKFTCNTPFLSCMLKYINWICANSLAIVYKIGADTEINNMHWIKLTFSKKIANNSGSSLYKINIHV